MIVPIRAHKLIAEKNLEPWTPLDLAVFDQNIVRVAKLFGEYHWHKHSDEDELFFVLKGSIDIQLRDQQTITLEEGDFVVIPKGVEHCPKATNEAYVLLFESTELKSKGD